ncbi:protein D2-like [Euwallacea similis]|uniref:protein D2-like n=1 Tax=Euwallacea similis TaxID=1736056 RepID=UPI00344FE94E
MILILFVQCVAVALTMADQNVAQNFISEDIVGDTIDTAPAAFITVTYPGNKQVRFNELTPTDVRPAQPEVTWTADPDKYYTLSMVDPDAPSRTTPTFREINHWLVVNIKENDLSSGQTLTSYRGSGPPKGSGLHRYIFLVYLQQGVINVTEPNLEADRRNFSIRKFAQKYNLGSPIAGNFYQAQWDSSVPERKA